MGRSQTYFKQQQDYLGHVNGHIEEMYGGHVVMKAFNGEAKSIETFDASNDPLYDAAWKSQFLSGLMMPIMMFIGNLGYVAVAILGGWLVTRGSMAVGDIQAFIQYVRTFTRPITQLANISNVLQQTAAAAERVFEFLAEPEEIAETGESGQAGRGGGPRRVQERPLWLLRRTRSSSTTFPRWPSRARRSPSLGRPARARRRWSSC